MSEVVKCFCKQYKGAAANPEAQIPMPGGSISGNEFIQRANMSCRGTTVSIGNAMLSAENVIFNQDETVTFPGESVTLSCEYFADLH